MVIRCVLQRTIAFLYARLINVFYVDSFVSHAFSQQPNISHFEANTNGQIPAFWESLEEKK